MIGNRTKVTADTFILGGLYKENLTRHKLHKITGLSVSKIRDMETGNIPITEDYAKLLGDAFKINYRVFL